jgi:hypothetical protein
MTFILFLTEVAPGPPRGAIYIFDEFIHEVVLALSFELLDVDWVL